VALRLGLLSTARINDAVLAAARAGEAVNVVAVASRDADRAASYAHRNGIATAHSSYRDLLEDTGVDAVHLSLPNSLHVEWALRAIAAGKHVLCEKPLAWTGADAAAVVAAARRAGVVLAEGFMYRHHPQTRALCELAGSGALGRVERIRSWFAFTAQMPQDAIVLDHALHGGALLDVGCYCVSVSRLLAGEPISMSAEMDTGPTGVDLRVRGTMRFSDGVEAEFEAALDRPDDAGVLVVGSGGTATLADPWHCLSPGIALSDGRAIPVASADPYRLQLDDFAAAVREGRPALVSGEEIVGQARTIEALIESGGARVSVADAGQDGSG
jgi:D-xylose 1-dehydrogenase (NADP+, D-xylono-1,5-lactone-forming)